MGPPSLDALLKADRRKRAQGARGTAGPAKIPTGPKAGIQKRKGSAAQPPSSLNGKWTHDLHASVNPPKVLKTGPNGAKAAVVLKPGVAERLASNRLFEALHGGGGGKTGKPTAADLGISIRGASKPVNTGITIRGSAGPFAVQGTNFAPGTTASDIRNVLEGNNLSVLNCGILNSNPTVIAEMLFQKKEDALRCIEEFNNRLADGRLLHFSLKDQPQLPIPPKARATAQRAAPVPAPSSRGSTSSSLQSQEALGNIVDGKYGFGGRGSLYSDKIVTKGRGARR